MYLVVINTSHNSVNELVYQQPNGFTNKNNNFPDQYLQHKPRT